METSRQDTEELIASDADQQQSFWTPFVKKAAIYGGGAVIVGSWGVPAILAPIGFASTGITSGSLAATWQASQSLSGVFSAIQSAAATNALGGLITKVGVGAGLTKACYHTKKDQIEKKPRIRSKL